MFSAPPEALLKQWESEQDRLRLQLVQEDSEDWQRRTHFLGLERVAGVDLSYIKGDHVHACAQLVVLSYPELQVLYEDSQMVALTAPYIAGFLAFRETPFLLDALKRLEKNRPDLVPQVVFVDGNGLFHYREFGLACHLGVLSGLPCVGVAKNLLQVQGVRKSEEHQAQVAALKKGGDSFPLTTASGKVLGKALRSSDSSSKPVYVSVGHRISLDTAVRLTHSCCRYRIPEPIRQADRRSREYLRSHEPEAERAAASGGGDGCFDGVVVTTATAPPPPRDVHADLQLPDGSRLSVCAFDQTLHRVGCRTPAAPCD